MQIRVYNYDPVSNTWFEVVVVNNAFEISTFKKTIYIYGTFQFSSGKVTLTYEVSDVQIPIEQFYTLTTLANGIITPFVTYITEPGNYRILVPTTNMEERLKVSINADDPNADIVLYCKPELFTL